MTPARNTWTPDYNHNATIAFDIDGTLMHANWAKHPSGPPPDDDPNQALNHFYTTPGLVRKICEPCPTITPIARAIQDGPGNITIITGRSPTLTEVTRKQIDAIGLHEATIHHNPEWTGHFDLANWKAGILEDVHANQYWGNAWSDALAARFIQIPYVDVNTLHLPEPRHPADPTPPAPPPPPAQLNLEQATRG